VHCDNTRIDLAIALIDRMKKLFARSRGRGFIPFDTKETIIDLNGVNIDHFYSITYAMRDLSNVSFIL
jgi:hypothetical protein